MEQGDYRLKAFLALLSPNVLFGLQCHSLNQSQTKIHASNHNTTCFERLNPSCLLFQAHSDLELRYLSD